MRVLGIDTATATASVALVERGGLVGEAVYPNGTEADRGKIRREKPNHAEIVLPLIEQLLHSTGLCLADISALAVSIGPGSFTGLRIGLSTVKGLAYGWAIPVVGVPTLEAVAARAAKWEGLICPILDARKKEVYAALFRRMSGRLERLAEDVVCTPGQVLERIGSLDTTSPCLFIGDGTRVYGEQITGVFGARAAFESAQALPGSAQTDSRPARLIHWALWRPAMCALPRRK
ncbi:MAG: tRNA (adenosine(37)-N6)-threonylcarbamoyltransferase complex dimerization subunit type 1 TsaB [Deltaproteobacteria bacterium]|nr:tRNA (adenosine(37)-N6)-threonylcarbamoyltransferase complex dimerization subunit type 1 TsaB [Deltaproteobacteria bacterium]